MNNCGKTPVIPLAPKKRRLPAGVFHIVTLPLAAEVPKSRPSCVILGIRRR